MARKQKGSLRLLSTRSGFRRYRVKKGNLEKGYVRVTPGREQARAIREQYPKFRYGQSYYVKKSNSWHVEVYGLVRGEGTSYAVVGAWTFYVRAGKTTENAVLKATFETFEQAGYSLIRFGDGDRVSLQVGVRGIDYFAGMDLLTLEQYREALEAKIAELDFVPPGKHAPWRKKSHHAAKPFGDST